MTKRKLTLTVEGKLIDEAKSIAVRNGSSLSNIFEELLEYIVPSEWIDNLAKELDLGELEPIMPSDIPKIRPKGLDSAKIVREIRSSRERKLGPRR